MSGITADTKLSELTDAQRAELGQKAREESYAGQPLVGQQESLDVLEDEYRKGSGTESFAKKIKWLKENAGFISFRRIRGDGNCFYVCFAYAMVQRLLQFNDRPMHHFVVKHLESTLDLLKKVGYEEDIYMEFWQPFKTLLSRMHSTDPSVIELDDGKLQEAFNDPETVNSIVAFLRLVTSAYLKDNAEDFAPFLFTLDDDNNGSSGGPPSIDEFCSNQVEAVGKEADHVQIAALSSCLKVSLAVAYLSRAGAPPETPAVEFDHDFSTAALEVPGVEAETRRNAQEDPDRCDIVNFEVPGAQMLEIGTLLFTPGHYCPIFKPFSPSSTPAL